jgi:pimeloyl-ACP methyl ester carboxylesterase
MSREAVVLVHGLWMHGVVMTPLARRVERHGYETHAFSYPSVRLALTENADRLAAFIDALAAPVVHIVAHSAGGLVALTALDRHPQLPTGRIVLLGVPYGGSLAAENLLTWQLGSVAVGHGMLGRTVRDWLALASRPAPARETGVIAGRVAFGMGRVVAPPLPEENDGIVCLSETAVPGMRERVVLDVSHSGMLVSAEVGQAACAFLHTGHFSA